MITLSELKKLRSWTNTYIESFKNNKDHELLENIELKELHTIKVCEAILNIGMSLNISDSELRLAETTALLHDIGRFEQYRTYKTFADNRSVNHAELGVEILLKYNVLDNLAANIKDLIIKTVRYHNRISIPPDETDKCIFFTKLLRDADKLDIYRVVTEYYRERKKGKSNKGIELNLPDSQEISENVITALLNRKSVNFSDVKNLNDFKLLQIGWVYDINFSSTLQSIKSNSYIDLIIKTLPVTDKLYQVLNALNSYIDKDFPSNRQHSD